MKTVLLTGGSGTLGKAFIKRYWGLYEFHSVSRNESKQWQMMQELPDIQCHLCPVEDSNLLHGVFDRVRPDIVLHLAGMKHIDWAEKNPIQAVRVNVLGSLNVMNASLRYNVPVTVAASTDKACLPCSTYGMTKSLMEKVLSQADRQGCRFALCRPGNIAGSNGSVLPLWLDCKRQGKPLPVTDPLMRRFMLTPSQTAELLHKAVEMCQSDGGFVLCKRMKYVEMGKLAKAISVNTKVVGARPGEKSGEDLVSADECQRAVEWEDYLKICCHPQANHLSAPYSTDTAPAMTTEEMRALADPQAW